VFYERWKAPTRARIDAVCYVCFFLPGMLFILYAGWVEARQAWWIGERAGGWPLYPFKAVIPLTAALLLLQGVSELIKCAQVIRERPR
jgi:TRAP-type mannitol/chloroaromatic compound transport system permease small subunit